MATTIQRLEARIGEDVRIPMTPASGYDTTDWATWSLKAYLYLDGEAVVTVTESATSSGVITRTGTGQFCIWFKSAALASLARGTYFWQCRRTDTGENAVLAEGSFELKPYAE